MCTSNAPLTLNIYSYIHVLCICLVGCLLLPYDHLEFYILVLNYLNENIRSYCLSIL